MCTAEYSACWEDENCSTCLDGTAMEGYTCNPSDTTDHCEAKEEDFCCQPQRCRNDALFLDYTSE